MAGSGTAWGIDIGQAGLKAIKLKAEGDGVRAVAFDYIPHPKILSQPDAIPEELITQAINTFLSRNNVKNDSLGIAVPGQTSLAKFIKLPPVEPGKVAEIVKYEAKQQIPFALEDVVWDYQTIGGGVEESGFMLEAEVGLFAMKRELVYEAMQPFTENKAEIELVQVSPLAIYNYLSYDVLGFRKEGDTEPPDAGDYYIMLDMGADNTTLMVSNGRNIWIRNVPIGGNHFTRALTREMKLTFAKAEHLKCNATKAPDPKAVFQAMRPVFNDYVTEIQRSIGYFGSVNRNANIVKVIGVGNGFKMAGLQKFLQQNLQYEVVKLDDFKGVTGDSVLSDPLFIDNIMTFAVPYGVALQALEQTRIRTTLLPPEIVVQRTIRRKKPWAVGVAAGLLLTMALSTFASANVLKSLGEEKWKSAQAAVDSLKSAVSSNKSSYDSTKSTHTANLEKIDRLTAPLRKRELWMELLKAVNVCLPRERGLELDNNDTTRKKLIQIESFVQKRQENLGEWHTALVDGQLKEEFHGNDGETAPEGEGYVITLKGHHFYNSDELEYEETGVFFVHDTLLKNLREWEVADARGEMVPVGRMGISHPIVVWFDSNQKAMDPKYMTRSRAVGMAGQYGGSEGYGEMEYEEGGGYPGGGSGYPGGGGGYPGGGSGYPGGGSGMSVRGGGVAPLEEEIKTPEEEGEKMISKTSFILQFVWAPEVDRDREPPVAEGAEGEDGAEAEAVQ